MYKHRRVIISVIAGILVFSLLMSIVLMFARAAKSVSEIEDEIDELEAASDLLAEEREALEKQIDENRNKTFSPFLATQLLIITCNYS